MEPNYTLKDETPKTTEQSETGRVPEIRQTNDFVAPPMDNETLPEESDKSITMKRPKETESAEETPQLDGVADQASSSSNNIAGMFTTTAGAVGVVAAVTLLNLGASDAQIIKVKSFENMVFYHVIVGEDTAVTPGSLQLRLQSTNDEYIVDLDFGETFGFVPRVTPETEFSVSLVGRNLIGATTLGQVVTATSPAPNAVLFFPELQNSLEDDLLHYQMRSYMEDPLNLATNLVLRTGYFNPYTLETTWFDDIPFDSGMTRYDIRGVPNRNSQVISQLTATILLEEPVDVVLDETRFYTPLYHQADAALLTVTNQTAQMLLIPDFYYLPQAVYRVRLLDVDRVVQVNEFTEGNDAIFINYERLFTSTKYGVEVVVSFIPPGQENRVDLVLYQEEFVTPDRLNVVTSAVANPTSAMVTVTANGNIAAYTLLYYEIDGERVTVPLPRRTADTALITLPFEYQDAPYTVIFGLTNEAGDPEYIIGPQVIERRTS
jgi:hypothetical protein